MRMATTIAIAMPIYEFECESCGERSEALVALGTESVECTHCGSPSTHRVLSAQAPSMRLVKSRGENRKQEARNANLHQTTKARFKETRRKQREKRSGGK
jgi:putative FmdB family regulatory protein